MELTRLILEPTPDYADRLDVVFDRAVAVIDAAPRDLLRIRTAIESLFAGRLDFGSARMHINGSDVQVNRELARHLGLRLGHDYPVVEAASLTTGGVESTDIAGTIALRAALELEGAVSGQLGPRDIDMALQTIVAERELMASNLRIEISEALRARDEASENLQKISHWKGNILAAHRETEEAREAATQRLTGALSLRRLARAKAAEAEVLRKGNFSDYNDFLGYSERSESTYRKQFNQASAEHDDAAQRLLELEAQRSLEPRAKQLAAQEYALRVRSTSQRLDGYDSMENALRVMLGLGLGGAVSHDPIPDATAWLHALEGESPSEQMAAHIAHHQTVVPVVGTVPLVIDGAFAKLDAGPRQDTLATLEEAFGTTQLIFLGPDVDTEKWALAR